MAAPPPLAKFEEQDCIRCFVRFGVPAGFTAARRADKAFFYCPNGHPMSYTESEADRLRRERDRAIQEQARLVEQRDLARKQRDWEIDRASAAERRASAARGQVTKIKRRVANSECPCCSASFPGDKLAAHLIAKHPQFVAEEIEPEAPLLITDQTAARDAALKERG